MGHGIGVSTCQAVKGKRYKLLMFVPEPNDDRAEQTTMIIVDSKSVQNADTGGVKGYDAGKKSPA